MDPSVESNAAQPLSVMLWLICPLLLFLLGRIWFIAHAGKLDEDPVLFAITDRQSQVVTLLCGLLIWLAT